jgi:hypothetical protein
VLPTAETAEALERFPSHLAQAWHKTNRNVLILGLVLIAIGPLLVYLVIQFCAPSVDKSLDNLTKPGPALVKVADSAWTGFGFLCMLALAGGTPLVGLVMAATGGVRLRSGPPKAGKSPKATVLQFYGNVLTKDSFLDEELSRSKAFICLTGAARQDKFGGELDLFRNHWEGVDTTIRQAAAEVKAARPKYEFTELLRVSGPGELEVDIGRVQITHIDEKSVAYQVGIHCNLKFHVNGEEIRPGNHDYVAQGDLMRVGSRWYLTDGKWSGVRKET